MSDGQSKVAELSDAAYQSIRSINHITGGTMSAPDLYSVLGNLKNVGHLLPQALTQMGNGLQQSLKELDVYEDDPSVQPEDTVAAARALMDEAATHAAQLGLLLERAQSAIAQQGYRRAEDGR